MTYGCRIGRLMSWDWENMRVFSGGKRVLREGKKKKGLSDTPASQAGGASRQAPAWPPSGFLGQCVTSILGWMIQGWVGEEEAVLFTVFAGSLVSTY